MSKKSNKNITRKEAIKKIIFSTILLLLLTIAIILKLSFQIIPQLGVVLREVVM